ncbi:hypothetical protein H1R20_g1032, partial [Candolleomyces eurysporus]
MLAEALACIAILSILALCLVLGLALASTVVRFLIQANQGHAAFDAMQSGPKHTQGKEEATIAGLQERLSRQEVELLLAATRNRVLTEENEKHQNSLLSMQKKVDALSEILSKAKSTVARRDATIIQLKEQAVVLASMVGAQLPPTTATQYRASTENEGYGTDYHFMQNAMATVSHGLWKAREMVAQQNAEIKRLEGRKTALESMVAELHPTLEKNRVLTEENQKCRSDLFSKRKKVDTLSKELSEARETVTQHRAIITSLGQQKKKLESDAAELTDRNRVLTEETKKYGIDLLFKNKFVDALSKEVSNARERRVQDRAAFLRLKRSNTELELEVADLTEGNRVLGEENQKHESVLLSMKEDMDALSEDLSKARELAAQHEATITSLAQRNMVLEPVVSEAKLLATNDGNGDLMEDKEQYKISLISMQRDVDTLTNLQPKHDGIIADLKKQEEELKFALDLKTQENNDLEQKLSRSEAGLKEKIEELADWKEFCKLPRRPESMHLIQIRQNASDSEKPSLRSILADQDHEIEKLREKLSQCHSQLALCNCSIVSPLLWPKQEEWELPASEGRDVQTL